MQRILSFLLVMAVILGVCGGCKAKNFQIDTGISFNKNSVMMLSDEHMAEISDDNVKIYSVDGTEGNIRIYAQFDGDFKISDCTDRMVLLEGKNSIHCFDLQEKSSVNFFDSVFTEAELKNQIRYGSFFADNGNYLVITKVINDKTKPETVNGNQFGYALSPDSGVYIYDITGEKPVLKQTFLVEEFALEFNKAEHLTLNAVDMGDNNIALFAEVRPAFSAFADQYFLKLNIENGNMAEIGSYSLKENQDSIMNISFFGSRLIVANTKRVLYVDYEKEQVIKSEYAVDGVVKSIDVYEYMKDSFILGIKTSEYNGYNKYTIDGDELKWEDATMESFKDYSLVINGSARKNNRLILPEDIAKRYPAIKESKTVYAAFSDLAFVCEKNGNTSIIILK